MPTGPPWPALASHTSTKLPSTVSSWTARPGRMLSRGTGVYATPGARPPGRRYRASTRSTIARTGNAAMRATDRAVEVAVLEPARQHEVQRGPRHHAELSAPRDGRRQPPGRDGHPHPTLDDRRERSSQCRTGREVDIELSRVVGRRSRRAGGALQPHRVHAAVDVHELAGRRREPVREQRDDGAGRRVGVVDVPAERGAMVPAALDRLEAGDGLGCGRPDRTRGDQVDPDPFGPRSRAR